MYSRNIGMGSEYHGVQIFYYSKYAIVQEIFIVECFHMKIVRVKILSSSRQTTKNFNNKVFKVKIMLLYSLNYSILCAHIIFSRAAPSTEVVVKPQLLRLIRRNTP